MKRNLLLLTALLAMDGSLIAEQEKPNILFIFADDLTYESIRAHGLLDIDTPHLDTLVEQGTSFTHAYNMGAWNGAVCLASRAMLNTGRFVWNAHNANVGNEAQQGHLWSQLMKDAGYRTYMTGKWHVSANAEQIFDVTADIRGGMPKQTEAGYNRPLDEEDYATGWKPWDPQYGGFWEGGTHWSEVVANHSIDFLKKAAEDDQPFFMYLAFNAGHDPRQAPKEYVDRYPLDRIKLPENFLPEYPYAEAICGKNLRDERLAPYPRTEYAVKINRQEYFALITHMDDQIGRILETLKETRQSDNTYIVFTADHGLSVGHHGLIGKQNMYDHSVRVPFMIVGPGVKAGASNNAPIYLQDIMPTTLELAGADKPEYVDFESLMPLLRGDKKKSYDMIYGSYIGKQRMITKDDWKLIYYPTANVTRLFNLKTDPMEMNDLAKNPEYADRRKQLHTELVSLSAELNDPLDYSDPIASWNKANPAKKKKAKKSDH
jgi:arylsulfatase A-like enzyme